MATSLPTTFDPLFARYAGNIPVAFLRALAQRESGMNPAAANAGSLNAARGLMQVIGVARESFNQRHGTHYTPQDLLNPEVSIRIGADLLQRIVGYYQDWAADAPNLREDWSNPEFVKLVVAGWNAGYSRGGGVQKVVAYLKSRGIPVTHDAVYQHAAAAGAVQYLQLPARAAWQRSVADLFYAQPDWRGGSSFTTLLLVGFIGWGLYSYLR